MRTEQLISTCLTISLTVSTGLATARSEVEFSLGTVKGRVRSIEGIQVDEFLGIPYARSPVGELRFALPVPYGEFGLLQATEFPPRCPQPTQGPQFDVRMDENCLFLNIYRRHRTGEEGGHITNIPVVVIFHGGSFTIGAGSDPFFYGAPLAAFGNVIVVTFNYRLGVLGFADMEQLAPGNLGLHDQRLVLLWVKNHIRAFGGDADRVTAMGVSAGAMSITAQMMSPINRTGPKLFHAAILDGGVLAPGIVTSPKISSGRMRKMASKLNCTVGNSEDISLACLRTIEAGALVALSVDTEEYSPIFSFHPTADGVFLPRGKIAGDIRDNASGYVEVRTLIGHARDEGSLFAGYDFSFKPNISGVPDTEQEFLSLCARIASGYKYDLDFGDEAVRRKVVEEFFGKHPTRFWDASEFVGYGTFVCPINAFVKRYSEAFPANVWMYRFDRKFRKRYGLLDPVKLGAHHISPFLFMTGFLLGAQPDSIGLNATPIDADDRAFMVDAMRMVASFAGTEETPSFRGTLLRPFGQAREISILDDQPSFKVLTAVSDKCARLFPYLEP